LAVVVPEWLQAIAPTEWYERYGERVENYDLPKTDQAREELASVIATDGQILLSAIKAETEQSWLREVLAVRTTTPATTPDDNMLEQVHESLQKRDLLPAKHLVDKGYTDSDTLVESKQKYGVEIVGPVAADPSWQARSAQGFDKSQFQVDWERKVVTCPAGKQSVSWLPHTYPQNGMKWEARFSRQDCGP
jgi:hypothetical protein